MSPKSPITTHVLDTARGRPAAGIPVCLERADLAGAWTELARGVTNADGRAGELLPPGSTLAPGEYRLGFDTAGYFASNGVSGFYPRVLVIFLVEDGAQHHHVPLLLSPYGYSTYRGS